MSTFVMRDEYLVPGEEWDEKWGIKADIEADGEDYVPYSVEFIRAWEDGTWDNHIVTVPQAMCHEKCTTDNLVYWYTKVYGSNRALRKVVYIGVFSTSPY